LRGWFAIVAVGAALLLPASTQAVEYAPVDQPGPPLSVPQHQLDAALSCNGDLGTGPAGPVLLVPGTAYSPETDFSWNWEPALSKLGIPWCAVALPGNGMGDVQVAAEYVVNGIRSMYAQAGHRISVLGHSQGGMLPRWAFRFWPDTRTMVDDEIGLSPSNHGTLDADVVCLPGCAPSFWQQADRSEFIKALNSSQETFPGTSYTVAYTRLDEVVVPNLNEQGSSALHGGGGEITNVAVQDVCPLDVSEHLAVGTYDNTAYALAIDALEHPGPADPSRISSDVCLQPLMPGVNPATFATDELNSVAGVAGSVASYPHVSAEPPLACYVTASCAATGTEGTSAQSSTPKKCKKGKHLKHGKCLRKRKHKKH
jgi:triacylglycerol esterase/lipase EstA (alpha/beta hydrolase family)